MNKKIVKTNPLLKYSMLIDESGTREYMNRVMVGTAVTGLVRIEWVMGRYNQAVPPNWSMVAWQAWLASYNPLGWQVADAQNLIVQQCLKSDYQWLLLIEHDNVLLADAFIRYNEWIKFGKYPMISGLYYTRAQPSEPLVFIGRGNSTYRDFKMGDLVWCDAVPTGTLLIHAGILKEIYNDSPEYVINYAGSGIVARRVFEAPASAQMDDHGDYHVAAGTSDINFCDRIIKGNYLRRAGWNKFMDDHADLPFLVDTNLFSTHIEADGRQYPPNHMELKQQLYLAQLEAAKNGRS